jgi:hypothetical protein
MSKQDTSGVVLTVGDVDEVAVRIGEMWDKYNQERINALHTGEEARQYIFATDLDTTGSAIQPHKNRTHQPKLTQLSDTLQSQYYEASLSMPRFFKFKGATPEDFEKARRVEAWVRTKLEQKKFRETVGRELLADYTNYGNCFAEVNYIVETDDLGRVTYKGPDISRVAPMDLVFNNREVSFAKAPKITRHLTHVAELKKLPLKFPGGGFKPKIIQKALDTRLDNYLDDWVQVLKDRGLNFDGYGGYDAYFKTGLAEVLVYRGDVFNPTTGESDTNRVVYVVDRVHVIRDEPTRSPKNFDGLHHAGWRVRNDNLWAQGPLDNLLGMQYRINHLENAKADAFDLLINPPLFIKGIDIIEPSEGYAPGVSYYGGVDEDVKILAPNTAILSTNNEIAAYHRMMEDFAGAPPDSRGIRTPGEKTAFEVQKLDANATMMFVDKARNFERLLETILKEIFELMMVNFDGTDYAEIFDDEDGVTLLEELSQEDVNARGEFVAVGARHWVRRNRETVELQNFQLGPMQDPKVRMHIRGFDLAKLYERKLQLEDESLIEEFAGVKEDVQAQAVAQAEQQSLQKATGQEDAAAQAAPGDTEAVQRRQGKPEGGPTPGQGGAPTP